VLARKHARLRIILTEFTGRSALVRQFSVTSSSKSALTIAKFLPNLVYAGLLSDLLFFFGLFFPSSNDEENRRGSAAAELSSCVSFGAGSLQRSTLD